MTRLWCSSGPAESRTPENWPCSSDAEVCVWVCVSVTEYSPLEVALVVVARLCGCWIETYTLSNIPQWILSLFRRLSCTFCSLWRPWASVFCFFVTGASLCIQLINQQNSLCMIGLQHWNECWRSHRTLHRRGLETHTLYLKHVSLTFRLFPVFQRL